MIKTNNKTKIGELIVSLNAKKGVISLDDNDLKKLEKGDTVVYVSFLSDRSDSRSPMASIIDQLKVNNELNDFSSYDICIFSINCHDSDDLKMDDLAKLQLFLSEHLNPEAEVTWEYGVDDDL